MERELSLVKTIKYELILKMNYLIGLICCAFWYIRYVLPRETIILEIICYFWILWCISFFSYFWLFALNVFRYCSLKYSLLKQKPCPVLTVYSIERWIEKFSYILVPQIIILLSYMYLKIKWTIHWFLQFQWIGICTHRL